MKVNGFFCVENGNSLSVIGMSWVRIPVRSNSNLGKIVKRKFNCSNPFNSFMRKERGHSCPHPKIG